MGGDPPRRWNGRRPRRGDTRGRARRERRLSIVRRTAQDWLRSAQHGLDVAAFALGPLLGAAVALSAGQETSWDFRNHHWYNAYSLLTWRYDRDVAVAHHATYNNPLLDVPYFLAGNALPPTLTLALLGVVEGLNFSLLYLIARSMFAGLQPLFSRLAALAIAGIGFLGGMSFLLIATTYYDNVVSLPVLGALLALLKLREDRPRGGPSASSRNSERHPLPTLPLQGGGGSYWMRSVIPPPLKGEGREGGGSGAHEFRGVPGPFSRTALARDFSSAPPAP